MESRDYWGSAFFDSGRLGTNADTSNQSLRGMLLRAPMPDALRTLVLAICLAVVAFVGYRRARMLSARGDEVAGVAVVGLLAVLLSPVAWIHHLAWIVLVLGVLAGELRTRRQAISAAAVGVFYGFPLPWMGAHLIKTHHPLVFGVPLRNAYGLGAIVLVLLLPARPRPQGEPDVAGHDVTRASRLGRLLTPRAPASP
jgi:alpha-1,2-mannosyltransferase